MKKQLSFSDLMGAREGITLVLLLLGGTVFSLLSPYFLSALNFSYITTDSVEIGMIGLTMTMVMVMGEIDLSVGSIVGLCAAVLGQLTTAGVPFAVSIFLSLLTGLAAGAINGLLCVKFGLPSLVVTLGTFALFRGIAEILLGTNTFVNFPSWFIGWDSRYLFWEVTIPQVFWLVCILLSIIILHRLKLGRKISFIGANPRAARFAGLPVDHYKIAIFSFSGLVSAVASLILVSRLQSLDNTAGTGFELVAITAVLLGGTDYRGGRGKILGTVIAVMLIGVVENGLGLLNVSSQITTASIGVLLILSIVIDLLMQKLAIQFKKRRSGKATRGSEVLRSAQVA